MYEHLKRQARTASTGQLDQITKDLFQAFADGRISDEQTTELSELIHARRRRAPARRKHVGARPRSPESIRRRRGLAASGELPRQLAANFSLGEQAALAILAEEARTKGVCDRTIGEIAARAGVCETTVRNALREAEALGWIRVERRRLSRARNLPNLVWITSSEWLSWLCRGHRVQKSKAHVNTATYSSKTRSTSKVLRTFDEKPVNQALAGPYRKELYG